MFFSFKLEFGADACRIMCRLNRESVFGDRFYSMLFLSRLVEETKVLGQIFLVQAKDLLMSQTKPLLQQDKLGDSFRISKRMYAFVLINLNLLQANCM